jgi:hypothetical protein
VRGGDHAEGAGELGAGGEHGSTVGVARPRLPLGTRPRRNTGAVPGVQGVLAAGDHAAAGRALRGVGTVGVLGISRSTTGASGRTAVRARDGCTGAPGPQDRYAPPGPAPHEARRCTRARSRPTGPAGVRAAAAAGAGAGVTGAVAGTGAADRAAATGCRGTGTGRAGGSGRGARAEPATRCPGVRCAAEARGRGRGRGAPPSARSSTSSRPARAVPD